MFRRTTSLPARPSLPNKEEIVEDLSNALPDDIIFTYTERNIKTTTKQPEKMFMEFEDYDFEEDIPGPAYLKVESFLDKVNSLRNNLISLEEQKTNMTKLEESLLQDMNRIKKELNTDAEST